MLQWIKDNPAPFTYLVATLVGIAFSFVDSNSRFAGLKKFFQSIGLDVPRLVTAIVQIFTGAPPAATPPADPPAGAPLGARRLARRPGLLRRVLGFGAVFALPVLIVGCALLKPAAEVTTRIADEICKEEATQPDEQDWVRIACQVEGDVSHVVHILLPRTAWAAYRAAHLPGK